ncbi:MAG: sugar-binding protein [Thiotrichaceae bacterium]
MFDRTEHNKPLLFIALLPAFLVALGILYVQVISPKLSVAHTEPYQANIEIIFPATNNALSPLGINTNEVTEEDTSLPYVDLFRSSIPFVENKELSSDGVDYDENGWPKNLHGGYSGTKFVGKMPSDALPQGDYTVLYEGRGEIVYGHDVLLVSHTSGKDIIRFKADKNQLINASLTISKTDPDNYIHNIRVLMPGGICQGAPFSHVNNSQDCTSPVNFLSIAKHYRSIIFNPDYLSFMKDFSVIRFMPMSGITRNPAQHWQERPNLQEASWGGTYGSRGTPLEIQVELANRLQARPWFNVPHGADDHYMRSFADFIHKNLSSDLKPYIEYTNEAWNSNFIHSEYTQKMGIAEGLDINAMEAGYKFYAQRSVDFFEIFENIYGSTENFTRVIGGWDTRTDISAKILSHKNTYQHVDALAIAPYIGGNIEGFRESKTVDDIFHLLTNETSYRSLPEIANDIKRHGKLARNFGVKLIAYEGGQGLVDWATRLPEQHPNPLFFAANRDPRMSGIYTDLLREWREAGGETFVMFSAPRTCQWFGCWGLKEYITQPTEAAPKYAASKQFIQQNPPWWNNDRLEKPEPEKIKKLIPTTSPDTARIVIRPATIDPEAFFRLDNPRSLHMMLEGEEWIKQDISGKWQAKWDSQNLYLTVKVYDDILVSDSNNPTDDDSIEFFIDADNSRKGKYDKINDFHYIFSWNSDHITYLGPHSPKNASTDFPVEMAKTADGYLLNATIPWSILRIKPRISRRIGIDVIVNDDDDGGKRDGRVAWVSADNTTHTNPRSFGVVLISGR